MNLILITIDCLRADHLSCLGYPKKTTPNLDSLASAGVLFTQAISVSNWTPASFISIFTSTYPSMYGGELWVINRRTSVTQILKEHGYHTAAFHSNPWLSSYYGYNKGFDTFDDSMPESRCESPLTKPQKLIKEIVGTKGKVYEFLSRTYRIYAGLRAKMHAALVARHPYVKGEDLNRKATSWLRGNPSNFFLWIHYMDAHEPYIPSSRFTSPLKRYHLLSLFRRGHTLPETLSSQELSELIDLYDAQISYVDKVIGSLVRKLKRSNILDNTFIIATADHGQQFVEHGHAYHDVDLYDELIHVPLIISGPGLEGKVIGQQVSLLDLAPTILDILKAENPKNFLGNSLLPLVNGNRARTRLEVISEADIANTYRYKVGMLPRLDVSRRMISIRTEKWKYIYSEGERDELYDLESDPKETRNVIDAEPEIAAELRAKIMAHIEFEEKSTPGEQELIRAKIGKLKSGGKI
jgi:arylsulfatase A-like enzyme